MILKRIPETGGDVQSFMLRDGQEVRLGREDELNLDEQLANAAVEDYPEYLMVESTAGVAEDGN